MVQVVPASGTRPGTASGRRSDEPAARHALGGLEPALVTGADGGVECAGELRSVAADGRYGPSNRLLDRGASSLARVVEPAGPSLQPGGHAHVRNQLVDL